MYEPIHIILGDCFGNPLCAFNMDVFQREVPDPLVSPSCEDRRPIVERLDLTSWGSSARPSCRQHPNA